MSWWSEFWGPSATSLLYQVLAQTRALKEQLTMQYTDLLALIVDINLATNVVAGKLDGMTVTIADLQAQIAAGTPVSQGQLDDLAALLAAEKATLIALGADPSNPIP